ncbi:hypothetical protein SAMN02745163_00502 [Clostridium cavendishii DSM 21758]|uniref:Uncharacterized protein n=1 Tax=Clostridium cavendishii DSM 21758 TaxID=1121302 RepID=A0A1M6CMS6_9CLOT|nr:hypothetical protein [Clostridium cavendishii]SHI62151.1 hypothetical protein SAMN02745163_00502 [Clostridium cavendishii DSM 21758]
MLGYNYKVSKIEESLQTSNIELGKCTYIDFNIELIYSVVKTPRK